MGRGGGAERRRRFRRSLRDDALGEAKAISERERPDVFFVEFADVHS
jgi:hypothetical protein